MTEPLDLDALGGALKAARTGVLGAVRSSVLDAALAAGDALLEEVRRLRQELTGAQVQGTFTCPVCGRDTPHQHRTARLNGEVIFDTAPFSIERIHGDVYCFEQDAESGHVLGTAHVKANQLPAVYEAIGKYLGRPDPEQVEAEVRRLREAVRGVAEFVFDDGSLCWCNGWEKEPRKYVAEEHHHCCRTVRAALGEAERSGTQQADEVSEPARPEGSQPSVAGVGPAVSPAGPELSEAHDLPAALAWLQAVVANDTQAMTFQTLGQYRTWLIQEIARLRTVYARPAPVVRGDEALTRELTALLRPFETELPDGTLRLFLADAVLTVREWLANRAAPVQGDEALRRAAQRLLSLADDFDDMPTDGGVGIKLAKLYEGGIKRIVVDLRALASAPPHQGDAGTPKETL